MALFEKLLGINPVSTSMDEVISYAWVSQGQSRGLKTFDLLDAIYHIFDIKI